MSKKDFKIPNIDIDEFTKNIISAKEKMEKEIYPLINKTKEAHEALTVPKQKKEVEINGKTCIISQLVDGRVLINFATIEESELYYTTFSDTSFYKRLYESEFKAGVELRNKWYNKFFRRFK
jgi:hypothetical protein